MRHGLQCGGNEVHAQVFDGGDIRKYKEAVQQLKEQNDAKQNRQDLQAALLFLFLGFFRILTEAMLIFDGKVLLSPELQGTSYHNFPPV